MKNWNIISTIVIIILFFILIFDLFFKIEFSSNAIEKNLQEINDELLNITLSTDSCETKTIAILNDNIIKINDITNTFLSDRAISFLFTILNIFLLSIGLYLISTFSKIKENIEKSLVTLNQDITNADSLQRKRQAEFKLYSEFNRLYSRYLSLKNSKKAIKKDSYNTSLRYILKSELTEINKTIKETAVKTIIINDGVYEFCFDIINEIKNIPSDKYEGSIPKDIIRVLHSTEELLKSIVKIEKKVATI